jgi:hypothetical protein
LVRVLARKDSRPEWHFLSWKSCCETEIDAKAVHA